MMSWEKMYAPMLMEDIKFTSPVWEVSNISLPEEGVDISPPNVYPTGLKSYNLNLFTIPFRNLYTEQSEDNEKEHYERLLALLADETVETGLINPSEEYMQKLYKKDSIAANMLLNNIFYDNLHRPHILIGVLHILSHFGYEQVRPQGQTMAIAALTNKDNGVVEYAVKCFENWHNKDGIRVLETVHSDRPWLQNYIRLVIRDLKALR